MNTRLLPLAEADVLEAADFYNGRQRGLGDRYLRAVRATRERILRFPRAAARVFRCPREREVRETMVDDFPFRLVYEIRPTEIVVVSVTHAHAKSQPWRRRLPPSP